MYLFPPSPFPPPPQSKGENKIELSRGMQYLQRQTESGKQAPQLWQERREIDYSKEHEPVKLKEGENAELQVRKGRRTRELVRGTGLHFSFVFC